MTEGKRCLPGRDDVGLDFLFLARAVLCEFRELARAGFTDPCEGVVHKRSDYMRERPHKTSVPKTQRNEKRRGELTHHSERKDESANDVCPDGEYPRPDDRPRAECLEVVGEYKMREFVREEDGEF